MSAALFGRRGRGSSIDDPKADPKSSPHDQFLGGPSTEAGPLDGSNLTGDARPVEERRRSPRVPADPVEEDVVDASMELSQPALDNAESETEVNEGPEAVIGQELLADLEARSQLGNPAPHPVRPSEMWHPDVAPVRVDPPAPAAEELVDPSDLEEGDEQPGRFRFNRLRRVSPEGGAADPVDEAPSGTSEERHADADGGAGDQAQRSVGDTLFGELFTSDRMPPGTEGLGSGAAPLVPPASGASGSLINGPVRRHRRGSGRALPQLPEVQEEVEVPGSEVDQPVEKVVEEAVATASDPISEDHQADPVVPPTGEVDPEPGPRVLEVSPDGSVDAPGASLRLDVESEATVTHGPDGVAVSLGSGWCWAALEEDAPEVTVSSATASVRVPAATSVLVTMDDQCACFVVVVRGEATMTHAGRRIRLRSGAMVLVPLAGEPQVDVASDDEIQSDPLVERNLKLDAAR